MDGAVMLVETEQTRRLERPEGQAAIGELRDPLCRRGVTGPRRGTLAAPEGSSAAHRRSRL